MFLVVPPSIDDLGWQKRGVCMDPREDSQDWWPEEYRGAADALAREADARNGCEVCPVRAECLGYALASRQKGGLWGGLDEAERTVLNLELQVPRYVRHGTVPGYVRDGCRCSECRAAKAAYERDRLQRGLDWPRRDRPNRGTRRTG